MAINVKTKLFSSLFYVDPTKITKYDCGDAELELLLLFWVCAAGKNGITAARCLDKFLTYWSVVSGRRNLTPFGIIKRIRPNDLGGELKKFGIGCYRLKAKCFCGLVAANLDLKTCTVEDLEAIPGIGPKTARCFLIHSRRDQKYAGLDRHILSYLRDMGYKTPKSTPNGEQYKDLEKKFLHLVSLSGKSVADFDLMIWKVYSGEDKSEATRSFLRSIKTLDSL